MSAWAWPARFALEGTRWRATAASWGFVEATLFFIVPDIVIGFVALWSLRRGLEACAWATLGATVGGVLVFLFAPWFQGIFPGVPGINADVMADAAERFATDGWWAMATAPLVGLPYKLFAAEAAVQGRSLAALVVVTPFARAWRFVLVALLLAGIGRALARWRDRWPWAAVTLYAAAWTVQYVVYFATIEARYG